VPSSLNEIELTSETSLLFGGGLKSEVSSSSPVPSSSIIVSPAFSKSPLGVTAVESISN